MSQNESQDRIKMYEVLKMVSASYKIKGEFFMFSYFSNFLR